MMMAMMMIMDVIENKTVVVCGSLIELVIKMKKKLSFNSMMVMTLTIMMEMVWRNTELVNCYCEFKKKINWTILNKRTAILCVR